MPERSRAMAIFDQPVTRVTSPNTGNQNETPLHLRELDRVGLPGLEVGLFDSCMPATGKSGGRWRAAITEAGAG